MRTIKLQATLDNPQHLLLPGMFANAKVVLPPDKGVVTVPATAVDYTLYGDSVFLIQADGKDDKGNPVLKVVRTFVKTGDRFDNRVVISTPIATEVSTAEDIEYLTSSSIQSLSTVTANIRLNYDPNKALTDVMSKVQQVKYQLPRESNDPVILKSTGETIAVMYIGF